MSVVFVLRLVMVIGVNVSDSQLRPIRPRPWMGMVGPSRPSWRVGMLVVVVDMVRGLGVQG